MTNWALNIKHEQDCGFGQRFGSYNHLTCFGGDEAYEQFVDLFSCLDQMLLAVSGFQLHIAKHSSDSAWYPLF